MGIIKLSLITEGRLEDVKRKWALPADEIGNPGLTDAPKHLGLSHGNLNEDDIDYLSQEDPSGNNKYLAWMVGMLNKEISQWDTKYLDHSEVYMEDVLNAVTSYHNNLARVNNKIGNVVVEKHSNILTDKEKKRIANNPKDINSFETLQSLEALVEELEELKKESPQRDKIYEDDRFIVVVPKTHSASCKYGAFSNWCVSTSNESYYKQYTENGMLAFIIWKEDMHGVDLDKAKENDNVYKLAVEVDFDSPSITDWKFWNKRDYSQDNTTIRNLLPKGIINSIQKYVDKILWEKGIYKKSPFDSISPVFNEIGKKTTSDGEIRYYIITPNTSKEVLVNAYESIKGEEYRDSWGQPFRYYETDNLTIISISYINNQIEIKSMSNTTPSEIYHGTWSRKSLYPSLEYLLRSQDVNDLTMSDEEYLENFILPIVNSEYTEEELKEKKSLGWSDVSDWGSIRVSDLQVGDRVRWRITTGGGWRRSDWGYNRRETQYYEGVIVSQTPSGYNVIEMDDGKKKRFKTVGEKRMEAYKPEEWSWWDVVFGETE